MTDEMPDPIDEEILAILEKATELSTEIDKLIAEEPMGDDAIVNRQLQRSVASLVSNLAMAAQEAKRMQSDGDDEQPEV